jgi:DNA repair protein RadC
MLELDRLLPGDACPDGHFCCVVARLGTQFPEFEGVEAAISFAAIKTQRGRGTQMDDERIPEDEVRQLQRLWEKRMEEGSQRIDELPAGRRPLEKLFKYGTATLSDLDLMVLTLGEASKSYNVFSLAGLVLKTMGLNNSEPDLRELVKIPGIEPVKAATVVASFELARRRIHPKGFRICWPTDVLPYIRRVPALKQEHLYCISLNGANEVLAIRTVAIGLVDRVHVHPREVYADPITDRASAVIIAHNHPCGDLTPTEDDKIVTANLKTAGETMGIQLLDHIIFNEENHYSFLENGEL